MTAYNETDRQPCATINLANADMLHKKGSSQAEDDEAYTFVEYGFRLHFRNGETIDFYADKVEDIKGFIEALRRLFGKSATPVKPWCLLVLAEEQKVKDVKSLTYDFKHDRVDY